MLCMTRNHYISWAEVIISHHPEVKKPWFWCHLGVVLISPWSHVGVILGSSWDHFWVILGSLLEHFPTIYFSQKSRDAFQTTVLWKRSPPVRSKAKMQKILLLTLSLSLCVSGSLSLSLWKRVSRLSQTKQSGGAVSEARAVIGEISTFQHSTIPRF